MFLFSIKSFMEIKFKEYEKKIKKIHKITFNPQYNEKVKVKIKESYIIPISIKAFQKLGWEVVFNDDQTVEAYRKDRFNNSTEKIKVTRLSAKEIEVRSISLSSGLWDQGKNSQRVKLFIYAFQEIEKGLTRKAYDEIENRLLTNFWESYSAPEVLPAPQARTFPNIITFFSGAVFISFLMGYAISWLYFKELYISILAETIIALSIALAFNFLFKISNYTHYNTIKYILFASVIFTFILSQLFILGSLFFTKTSLTFADLVHVRISNDIFFQSRENIYEGFLISFSFQIALTLFIAILRVNNNLRAFKIKRVPHEVIDYAYNRFLEGKNENQVRLELTNKGWVNLKEQNEVMEAVEAFYGWKNIKTQ